MGNHQASQSATQKPNASRSDLFKGRVSSREHAAPIRQPRGQSVPHAGKRAPERRLQGKRSCLKAIYIYIYIYNLYLYIQIFVYMYSETPCFPYTCSANRWMTLGPILGLNSIDSIEFSSGLCYRVVILSIPKACYVSSNYFHFCVNSVTLPLSLSPKP